MTDRISDERLVELIHIHTHFSGRKKRTGNDTAAALRELQRLRAIVEAENRYLWDVIDVIDMLESVATPAYFEGEGGDLLELVTNVIEQIAPAEPIPCCGSCGKSVCECDASCHEPSNAPTCARCGHVEDDHSLLGWNGLEVCKSCRGPSQCHIFAPSNAQDGPR